MDAVIALPGAVLRRWRADDRASLAEHANDARIAANLRDRFPHPYTHADADAFIALATGMSPQTFFAIAVDDRAVGGIGYTLHGDIERVSAEVGYWLGVAYWGRGIVTAAVTALTAYAFARHPELQRVFAVPFVSSTASIRVLEKAGYTLEGRMRRSFLKHGVLFDQCLYAWVLE